MVVHIIYSLGTGGLENGLVNIINRTPPGRYRHAIICLTTSGTFAQRITFPGVQIVELHKQPGHDIAMYWRLWRALRTLRPAIVHSRNLAALETQIIGLCFPGVKRVHGEHGRDITDIDGSNWKYSLLRKALRPLIHCYIAVSVDLAHWLAHSIGVKAEKIRQIYNGVDQSQFHPGEHTHQPVFPDNFLPAGESLILGTVGRLAEIKNQSGLLEALEILLRDNPDLKNSIRCILVGDGPLRHELEQQIEARGLTDIVWMPGDRSDIPELLLAMDVFLLPSLGEGVSNTVLEAMASGLPVIASDVGGTPELVVPGVTGTLVPVADNYALYLAIKKLLKSADTRIEMGRNARKRVEEKFDWGRAVGEYLAVYDHLLRK